MIKTNVMRILDKAKIDYDVKTYDVSDGLLDGVTAAKKVGLDPETVFKTLVTQTPEREFLVFVIPVSSELDLKKAAKSAHVKSTSMIPQKLLLPTTGYIHGGCSPIGMKKRFRTFIHDSAENYDVIAVSAGKIGEQIILSPASLKTLVCAEFADITRNEVI